MESLVEDCAVTTALPKFARSAPLMKKSNGMLVCRNLREISSSMAGLLEQSDLTLQCGNQQELVCASGTLRLSAGLEL